MPGTWRDAWRLARIVLRSASAPLVVHILPRWTLLAFAVLQLDAMVDWRASSAMLQSKGPWFAALCGLATVALHAGSERAAVTDLIAGARHDWLRRQPVARAARGMPFAMLSSTLALPVGLVGLLVHGSFSGAVLWTIAAAVAAVAAVEAPLWLIPVALLSMLAIAATAAVPWAGPLTATAAAALAVPSIGALLERPAPSRSPATSTLAVRGGVLGALLHRDLLAVWRTDRRAIWPPVLIAGFTWLVVASLAAHGDAPQTIALGAFMALGCAAAYSLVPVVSAAKALGRSFDPPQWPVREWQRALSLAGLASLTMVPSWAMAAVSGPIAVVDHARIGLFVAAIAAGAAWWVAARPSRPAFGSWTWWVGGALLAAMLPRGWPVDAALAGLAFRATVQALRAGRA